MKKKVNINVVKMGSVINLSVDGKLQKKVCKTSAEANELFKAIQKAKENPTDENVKAFRILLSDKVRVAVLAGLESDPLTGEVFLAGFNTPVPDILVEVIREYHENKYPMDALINFWKLLMINPDKRIRESLFRFIKLHDFSITDEGYMVVYKAVYFKNAEQRDKTFETFISNQVLHVKKDWKCSPNKYAVYKNLENGEYGISKVEVVEKWDETEKNVEVLGNLGELFKAIFESDVPETTDIEQAKSIVYTDMYTRKMTIVLGKPVVMERKECDSDPAIDCSYGLHCGATEYVESYGSGADAILVCYVNPAHVVAVPNSDGKKMRVSEYFPYAVATYTNHKIDVVETAYFESDYKEYEVKSLEDMIAKVQAEELPIATAKKAKAESRPMSELMKILKTRLVEIE